MLLTAQIYFQTRSDKFILRNTIHTSSTSVQETKSGEKRISKKTMSGIWHYAEKSTSWNDLTISGEEISVSSPRRKTVVSYEYDPWGNILSVTGSMASTLGVDNPFRYRSYYYDTESGLYYLNSRYYDAKVCRFINTDNIISNNIYSYCYNNPVNYYDITG